MPGKCDMSVFCEIHKIRFPKWEAFHAHKMTNTDHISCDICSTDFHTEQGLKLHRIQMHPAAQELYCHACNIRFIRLGSLIGHLELDRCPGISIGDRINIAARKRQQSQIKAEFGARLKVLNEIPQVLSSRSALASETLMDQAEAPLNYPTGQPITIIHTPTVLGDGGWDTTPPDDACEFNLEFKMHELDIYSNKAEQIRMSKPEPEIAMPKPEPMPMPQLATQITNLQPEPMPNPATKITTSQPWTMSKPATKIAKPGSETMPKPTAKIFKPEPLLKPKPANNITKPDSEAAEDNLIDFGLEVAKGMNSSAWATSNKSKALPKKTEEVQYEYEEGCWPRAIAPSIKENNFPSLPNKTFKDAGMKVPNIMDTPLAAPVPNSIWETKHLFAGASKPTAQPGAPKPDAKAHPLQIRGTTTKIEYPAHDPSDPSFRAERYWVAFVSRYKCPHRSCNKSFEKEGAFISHLQSAPHSSERMTCSNCHRSFSSWTALTQHSESQGVRCNIRETSNYNAEVKTITSGIAGVDGRHRDDTVRYVVNTEEFPKASLADRMAQAHRTKEARIAKQREEYWHGRNLEMEW